MIKSYKFYIDTMLLDKTCPYCRQKNYYEDYPPTICSHCRSVLPQPSDGMGKGLSGLALLVVGVITLGLLFEFVTWVWSGVVSIYEWFVNLITAIWNVVTWPFIFVWKCFDNLIIRATDIIGIYSGPAWWHTLLLAIFIIVGIFGLAIWGQTKKGGIEKLSLALITSIILGLIASGIWGDPYSSTSNKIEVVAEKISSQNTGNPHQEQVPLAPTEAPPQTAATPGQAQGASGSSVVDNTPFAPSFDCSKASNNTEKMICGDRALSRLDVQLTQAYSVARERAADKNQLKSDQIAWVKNSRTCPDIACLTKSFQDRIKQLSN